MLTAAGQKGYNVGVVGETSRNQPTSHRRTMKDDERYQKVMSAYKIARRDPNKKEEARKLLDEAFRLEEKGEVSPEVVEGMAYL